MAAEGHGAVQRLAAPQFAQARDVLARAFMDDPMLLHIMPRGGRARLVPWFVGTSLRYGLLYGEVYTSPGRVEGIAIWLPPGRTTLTFGRMFRAGMLAAPLKPGMAGFRRFMDVAGYTDTLHKRHAAGRRWYLFGLGVDPARQRTGIGGALLQPVLTQADAEGLPCYLETMNETNLPFYRRHGFEVAVAGQVPKGGPRVWAMVRPPQRSG